MVDRDGLKIVFAGTPDFAAYHLHALLKESSHQVVAVYTQPDRPAGRGKKLQASPVKQVASQAGLPIEQPDSLKSEAAQNQLAHYQPDLMVVVAYGLLLPRAVLDTPTYGCINVHASLLPRWRGAAPIQRAIEAGDNQTGVTIMQMDAGLDTGDMLHKVQCPIRDDDTALTLHDRLADLGPPALLHTLQQIQAGTLRAEKQDDTVATYANKLKKEEARLDWNRQAATLARQVRAFNPFPIAYTLLDDDRMRILQAAPELRQHNSHPGTVIEVNSQALTVACGTGSALAISRIQLPGKKPMSIRDALNGSASRFVPGMVLAR